MKIEICPENHVVLVDRKRLTLDEIDQLNSKARKQYNRLLAETMGGMSYEDKDPLTFP